ncbi:ImmA/IrrE family metallo-endopeptidase [Bythopirellula goksoeyrii]|uniref:IrrE N-terminal-like domain-containing protein n=1 Tax=Bythopirellula goksoeyrii TaxID=1400387 RepID=A0A5B9Q8W7_9BACT|nr:ImmA/IrrE family metallo-endopeptidase [Bythopirellula goksoeyrii]QEG34120.1 hypothetical protein Pr1d_13920 [Bythopirellula goksoeyrii]
MLLEIPPEQIQTTIEQCARELLAEAGIEQPPVDAIELARRLGLTVAQDGPSEVRARFVRLSPHSAGTILLADEVRSERRQWAVAHEIGEFATRRVFAELGVPLVDIQLSAREQMANQLAGALLLPGNWFQANGDQVDWDLLDLKSRFDTASHELIARRMLQMSPAVIISLFDQGKLIWRRSNLMHRPRPLTDAEHKAWQVTHQQCQASRLDQNELPEGLSDIRCWPVHEANWSREIMRTELEEWQ